MKSKRCLSLLRMLLCILLLSTLTYGQLTSTQAQNAYLTIKTSLRYAEIFVGNEWVGKGSIHNLKLSRDIYPVRVETPYCATYFDTLDLVSQATVSLDIKLEPLMGEIQLQLNTDMAVLQIAPEVDYHLFVAGDKRVVNYKSEIPGRIRMPLQSGLYKLRLTSPGNYPLEANFDILQSQTRVLNVDLLDGRPDYVSKRSSLVRRTALFVLLSFSQNLMNHKADEHYNKYLNALTVTDAESNHSKTQFYDGASIITLTLAAGVGAWTIYDFQELYRLGRRIQIKQTSK